jgi:hypothetical protein
MWEEVRKGGSATVEQLRVQYGVAGAVGKATKAKAKVAKGTVKKKVAAKPEIKSAIKTAVRSRATTKTTTRAAAALPNRGAKRRR